MALLRCSPGLTCDSPPVPGRRYVEWQTRHLPNMQSRVSAPQCAIGARRRRVSLRRYEVVSETFNSGTSWPVPFNFVANTLTVEAIGGGGGGGRGISLGNAGGGGGGGAYASSSGLTATPNASVTYAIGAGGQQGLFVGTQDSTNGGNTTWNTNQVIAEGGKLGNRGNTSSGSGGAGGNTTVSVGTTAEVAGSAGGNASGSQGGAGGAAASGGTLTGGATAPSTSDGLAGNNGSINGGKAGNAPGGGGGGGRNLSNGDGGPGAAGRIKITYTLVY